MYTVYIVIVTKTSQLIYFCSQMREYARGCGRKKKSKWKKKKWKCLPLIREKIEGENRWLVKHYVFEIATSFCERYLRWKGYGVRFLSPMVVQASFSHWSPQIRDVTTPAYVKVKHAERQYIVVRHVDRVSTLNHPLLLRES